MAGARTICLRIGGLKIGVGVMAIFRNALLLAVAVATPQIAEAARKPVPPPSGPVSNDPISILPPGMNDPVEPAPTVLPPPVPAPSQPVAQAPVLPPIAEPAIVMQWSMANANGLLKAIDASWKRGLMPADYSANALREAMKVGEGEALDALASQIFTELTVDLRDGRTPASGRASWLIKDTDASNLPVSTVMKTALDDQDIDGTLSRIEPRHPDYAALKAALVATPTTDVARIRLIRANLDRWRWLPRALGDRHLIANVPEYTLRVMSNNRLVASYPVIVGKPATATPQLAAMAQGVVIHPPWYLPRSVLKEGVANLIATNPARARAQGYTWTGSGPTLSVIQKAGPTSALGLIKIDMPNPDAIFIHDTPNRTRFTEKVRALSHGCLRTDRAMELGILLGIMQSGADADQLADLIRRGKTEKVLFKEKIPVYIGYFTMATGADGKLQAFNDIYGRDAPVFASFAKPRVDDKLPSRAPVPVADPTPAGDPAVTG